MLSVNPQIRQCGENSPKLSENSELKRIQQVKAHLQVICGSLHAVGADATASIDGTLKLLEKKYRDVLTDKFLVELRQFIESVTKSDAERFSQERGDLIGIAQQEIRNSWKSFIHETK